MHQNDTVNSTYNYDESAHDFMNMSQSDLTGRQSITQSHTDHQPWMQPYDGYSMNAPQ